MPIERAFSKMASRLRPVARLRTLLQTPGIKLMPCCHDALSARLVEQAGFPLTFVSGFAASAARGLPDTGLMSYAEMLEVMSGVGGALREIPCMGDGDTGYGNAVNTKRTVQGYARAGMAGIMIEDQVAPKRCGHTRDKAVIGRAEAVARVRAAVDAAREGQDDIVILDLAPAKVQPLDLRKPRRILKSPAKAAFQVSLKRQLLDRCFEQARAQFAQASV